MQLLKLREIRTKQRITQEKLSEMVGVTQSHYSKIERCVTSPSADMIFALAKILNVSVNELVGEQPGGTNDHQ